MPIVWLNAEDTLAAIVERMPEASGIDILKELRRELGIRRRYSAGYINVHTGKCECPEAVNNTGFCTHNR